MSKFFQNIYDEIKDKLDQTDTSSLEKISKALISANKKKKKIIILGNGGSAAIASHVSVDLTKNAGIKSINFNESDLITCLSNDFGYKKVFSKSLEFYAEKGDVVIILVVAEDRKYFGSCSFCKKINKTFYFYRFSKSNPLSKLGDKFMGKF